MRTDTHDRQDPGEKICCENAKTGNFNHVFIFNEVSHCCAVFYTKLKALRKTVCMLPVLGSIVAFAI